MLSPRFFIDRPIFATVLSIVVTLAGGLAVFTLPVSQYPKVTPPTVQVDCNYPGASSTVVAETIAAPIEQQVNGVEDMMYMSSQCTSDGTYTLTVTFRPGTDLDMSQVRVLNRVALAMPQLPDVVRATGITTRKRSPEILMTIALTSPPEPGYPDGRYDQLYLSNYAVIRVKEELARLPGISDVTVFGQRDYAMRVWVDPEKLAARNLTAADVVARIREQNAPVPAGQIGQPPTGNGSPFQFTLDATGRLTTAEEFGQVVLKVGDRGQVVKVRDVARVEMGAKSHDVSNRFDTKPTIGLAVFLLSDANALEVADAVKEHMAKVAKDLPPGISYEIGYDTSPFIGESINEVFKSLRDAILLVAVVVLVFLQTWRAAMIPLAAVPVAIVGTFAAMAAAGFTINNLTLFGLVLAVGIVVDDAIVVVEAVQHQLEKGYAPREATIRAMDEVAGPVVAVGVVLSAVFIPCAFLSGIVGQFFRQFALTIAVSTAISTFNSLTLSPALCAIFLRPKGAADEREPFPRLAFPLVGAALAAWYGAGLVGRRLLDLPRGSLDWLGPAQPYSGYVAAALAGAALGWVLRGPANRFLGLFFRAFNWGFTRTGRGYVRAVGLALKVPLVFLLLYAGLIGTGVWGYGKLPTGFIPAQDKGYLIASIQLPDAAAAHRTEDAVDKIARAALDLEIEVPCKEGDDGAVWAEPRAEADGPQKPGRWVRKVKPVKHCNAVAGNSFVLSAYGSNFGSMFIILEGFDKRRAPELYADQIRSKLMVRLKQVVPEADVNLFGAPAVSGLGRAGGFRIMVEDRGSLGPKALQINTDNLIDKTKGLSAGTDPETGKPRPVVTGLFSVYKTNAPQVYLDVDRAACLAHMVELGDVYDTIQATMGARYTNDFNRFGRTWQVNVQADDRYRNELSDIRRIKVRNRLGQMVPLGSVTRARLESGPLVITRYNTYPAAAITGNVAAGVSTGDAIKAVEDLGRWELPPGMTTEWTELTYVEQLAQRTEIKVPGVGPVRGNTTVMVFALSVVFVFLVLAALYESWAFPLAVILVVPVCVVGSLAGVAAADQDINIFTQVGFVVLVGLACKNAILIVEFAKVSRDEGTELRTAVLDACALRFRPILMTSVAFILGVLPLAAATGAGAEMRRALGVAVLGGMAGVTVFGIFLTPVFFAVVDRLTAGPVFKNRYVRAVSDAVLWTLSFRFVRPLVRTTTAAAGMGLKKLTGRKPSAK
jgi:multidrug efflux pump